MGERSVHLRDEATDCTFRYVVEDEGCQREHLLRVQQECLVALAASEREFASDDDYLDSQE